LIPGARARREIGAAVVFVLLYLLAYPRTIAIVDESDYLSTALVYRAGTIHPDVAGVSTVGRVPSGEHSVVKFAPLWPLLLVPFTFAGWKAAFAATLLVHLAGYAVFVRLVRASGLPWWTALLYLAHPTLVYYSRTLMSDVAAGVLFLAAWERWTRAGTRPAFAAGIWTGVSCAVRYTNAVLAVLFVAAAALDALRTRSSAAARRVAALAAGLVPPVAALAVYNRAAFGLWWRGAAGYRDERTGIGMEGQFGWHVLGPNLEHYVVALLLVFPLMLLAVFVVRGRNRFVLPAVALSFTLFFSFYYFHDRADGLLGTAVAGLRFLIPVLPLFLLAYAEALPRWLARLRVPARPAGAVVIVAAAVATGFVDVRHDAYLRPREDARRLLYSVTPDGAVILCDTAARKLLHDVWGRRVPVRVEYRGRWEVPPPDELPPGPVYVAMAGRGLRRGLPSELAERVGEPGAEKLVGDSSGATLSVWSLPGATNTR